MTRILVLDDDEAVRQTLDDVLTEHGYHVDTAADGAEALRRIAELHGRVRAVVTDLNMPVLGGLELVRVLRKQAVRVSVVVMSGSSLP